MLTDRHALAVENLQHDLRRAGIDATITELNANSATATVVAQSYVDWLPYVAEFIVHHPLGGAMAEDSRILFRKCRLRREPTQKLRETKRQLGEPKPKAPDEDQTPEYNPSLRLCRQLCR
jgi:hypothetical protein